MSNKILRHTFIFSFFVLLAQVIGLVRDILMLRFFGAGAILDTYYLAFKIPDFLNLFYSVLLGSVILIPLLIKVRHDEGDAGVQREIDLVGSFVMTLVIIATAVLYFIMPLLTQMLAPNWPAEQQIFLAEISRVLLLAQLFFPIGIMFGVVGMIYEKPLGFASAGAIYNIFILLGAVFLTPMYGIYGVVYGVIFGAIMFSIVQASTKEARKYLFGFKLKYNFAYYVEFVKKNIWRFITVFLNQFFAVMVATLAALGGAGQLTLFSNAHNIYMAIFYVLGASFATAIMPYVSRLHVSGEHSSVKDSLTNSVTNVFSLSLYFSIFVFFFSPEIVGILYHFSNLAFLEENLMIHLLQILSFSIATLNVIDVVRKYMYTIDMAYESIYVMLSYYIRTKLSVVSLGIIWLVIFKGWVVFYFIIKTNYYFFRSENL
jgi:putative peptidoglycan lipid II flippase